MTQNNSVYILESKDPEDCRTFNSVAEIQLWIDEELGCLTWANELVQKSGHLREYINVYHSALGSLKAVCDAGNIDAITTILANYRTSPGYTLRSTIALFLKDFAVNASPDMAGQAGLILVGREPRSLVLGQVLLALYQSGIYDEKVRTAERASSESIRLDWTKFLDGLKSDLSRVRLETDKINAQAISDQKDHQRSFSEQMEHARKELDGINAFYKEHLALEAPVVHWKEQHRTRKVAARWFTVAFIVVLVFGVLAISLMVDRFVLPRLTGSSASEDRLWVITLLLLAAGAFTWPLRMLSKMIMSNVHLSADAEERAVLAKVYLSLLAEEKYDLKPDERKIVLATLFRSGATGIVADDGSSNTAIDLAAKLFNK